MRILHWLLLIIVFVPWRAQGQYVWSDYTPQSLGFSQQKEDSTDSSNRTIEYVQEHLPVEQGFQLIFGYKGRNGTLKQIYEEMKERKEVKNLKLSEKIKLGGEWDDWKEASANEVIFVVNEQEPGKPMYLYFYKDYYVKSLSLTHPVHIGWVPKKFWGTRVVQKIHKYPPFCWAEDIIVEVGVHLAM